MITAAAEVRSVLSAHPAEAGQVVLLLFRRQRAPQFLKACRFY
jgi:hypothetical protein